jgi:hypothetical protein
MPAGILEDIISDEPVNASQVGLIDVFLRDYLRTTMSSPKFDLQVSNGECLAFLSCLLLIATTLLDYQYDRDEQCAYIRHFQTLIHEQDLRLGEKRPVFILDFICTNMARKDIFAKNVRGMSWG